MLPVLLLALAACTPTEAPAGPALAVADTGRAATLPLRKPGVLRLEGQRQRVTLVRFDEAAVPFTTYYPERELAPAVLQTSEGTLVRFVPTFGGRRLEGAVATFVFPAGAPSPDAVRAATFGPDGLAGRQGWAVSDAGVSPCLWAEEGRLVQFASDRAGFVCVGAHGGRGFRLEVQAPAEVAEGLSARVDVLLEELRWRTTGTGLE